MPGSVHSESASETTVAECSLPSCVWDRFRIGSHSKPGQRLRWVTGVCMFRCNQPSALLSEWQGSFTCHCGSTGVERTSNKSQHTKLTLEKKILPPLLPGFELATFRSRVGRAYQQAIPTQLVAFCIVWLKQRLPLCVLMEQRKTKTNKQNKTKQKTTTTKTQKHMRFGNLGIEVHLVKKVLLA